MNNPNKKISRNSPLINDRIQFPIVRVIDSEGEQLGILGIIEAKNLAKEKQLDLVLISDKSDPPVCRIINYGKYKFAQEKKAKEARKKQQSMAIKEVKMRYNIETHDYNVRLNQATRFLQAGDKVKTTVNFRGREIQHSDLAIALLNKMAFQLEKVAELQQKPLKEGRSVTMILSPKKNNISI
uniref:translation initiation factor 3 n=1 Tax=Rhodaphanes brevistipitata TaxID=446136 RepID=UPI001FCD3C8D|nr:translation initiation factor 3 [Rhodaphanes brevistipitata]UNJ18403.1 translation initiation factor 3 [Rhodaphanes brevistipitata]